MTDLLAALFYGLKYFTVWCSGGMFFVALVYILQSNPLCLQAVVASMFCLLVASLSASVEKTLKKEISMRREQS